MASGNYVAQLNEYAQKTRSVLKYEDLGSVGPAHDKTFTQRAVLNDKVYPNGVGKTKKEAKQNAAANALKSLSKQQDPVDSNANANYNCAPGQKKDELSQHVFDMCNKTSSLCVDFQDESFSETNFIGIINHYCQKTKRHHTFIEERRCGPPHNPQFFYKLMIDKKGYPVGEGKTAKEAKQKAAKLAWSALQEQSDWDSKVSVKSTVSEDEFVTPPIKLDNGGPSMSTSDSDIFSDSWSSSNNQDAVKGENSEDTLNGTTIQPRFKPDFDIIECLGHGAFGCVFKATHKLTKKGYAVKVVQWEEKCLREVKALSDLDHPNIVRYHTVWVENSGYKWDEELDTYRSVEKDKLFFLYIQMELCDDKTLRDWIDEKNAQSLQDSKRREESLSIAQQIVTGVGYIHSSMLIHRDLKPANIMFGPNGKVKIVDFGLVTRDNDDSDMTERTLSRGTPTYMAPEQKGMNYDRKVDIYALGLIYFELLWKFSTGSERARLWYEVRSRKFPKGFSLAFHLENPLITSMLCEKPEDRPEASKLKAKLEEWAQIFKPQNNMHQQNKTV